MEDAYTKIIKNHAFFNTGSSFFSSDPENMLDHADWENSGSGCTDAQRLINKKEEEKVGSIRWYIKIIALLEREL